MENALGFWRFRFNCVKRKFEFYFPDQQLIGFRRYHRHRIKGKVWNKMKLHILVNSMFKG
jgi:hypothetical protein